MLKPLADNDLAAIESGSTSAPQMAAQASPATASSLATQSGSPGNTSGGGQNGSSSDNSNCKPCKAAQSDVSGVSKLVGLLDPTLGAQLSLAGTAAVSTASAIDSIYNDWDAGAGLIANLLSSAALGGVGTIVGAAVDVFSGLFGSGSNANAAVLQQLQKLSQQITRLQQDMDSQFAKVDATLNTILTTLNQNFALINYNLGVLNGNVTQIQHALLNVEAQLDQMQYYSVAYAQAEENDALMSSFNACLNYRFTHNNQDIGNGPFNACANSFISWAETNAANPIWAPFPAGYTDGALYDYFEDFSNSAVCPSGCPTPFAADVNGLSQIPAQIFGLPPLSTLPLPNPDEWILGVRAYLSILFQWPQYASGLNVFYLNQLSQIGTSLQQAAQNANSTRPANGPIAQNPELFNPVKAKNAEAVSQLNNATNSVLSTFTSNPQLHLSGLNLWGGPNQTVSYIPAALSAGSLPDCGGGSSWNMPPNLASAVSPLLRSAEQLGIGNVTVCLNFSWYWAGSYVAYNPHINANITVDGALGAYQIRATQAGGLVFAETIYGFSITDPTHQNLQCMGRSPLRTGNTELWSDNACKDEYNGSFTSYSITTRPVGSGCQTLGNATSGSSPLIWNLSGQFSQFVNQNRGLYVCVPYAPLGNLFYGNSLQTSEVSAGLNALSASITHTFAADQQSLYSQIAGQFSGTTSVSAAGQSLSLGKVLYQAYANFGLPNSMQTSNLLRSSLNGTQAIYDGPAVQNDFNAFSTAPVIDTTDNKITDEIAAINSRLNTLNSAINSALQNVQSNQLPESLTQVDTVLADLQAFANLQNANALSPCSYQLSSHSILAASDGGPGSLTVQELNGCNWRATTDVSWIAITNGTSGTGSGTISYSLAANPNTAPRSALVMVGDQVFAITQFGQGSPVFGLSATSLNFSSQTIVTQSSGQSVTLTNLSNSPLSTGNIGLSGPNAGDFTYWTNCPASLTAMANCTINIKFMPRMMGSKTAMLTVNSDTITLSGSGQISGTFEIMSMPTGKVLEVPSGASADGTLIDQNNLNGNPERQWRLIPTSDGYYEIQNVLTGKVLDVVGGYATGGTRIQQWDFLGGLNQQWQLVPIDDVHYAIINRNSGLGLDVVNGSTANGTNVQQWTYLGNPNQQWVLVPVQSYTIANALSSFVLDLPNSSSANGTLIQQWSSNGYRQQQWQFVPVGGGYVAIMNRNSGKVLDVIGGNTNPGTLIQEWNYVGGINQQWQLVQLDSAHFRIVNRNSGFVLDDMNYSTTPGTQIQQWPYEDTSNQQWQITPVTYYNIMNVNGLALDVINGSAAPGTNIQQWASNSFQQQQWQLIPLGNGYYAIMNNLTSQVLDVANSATVDGALIEQNAYSASASQQWQLIGLTGGSYEIMNRNSGRVLDVTGGYTSAGALIQQWNYLGGSNQQWRLVPTAP